MMSEAVDNRLSVSSTEEKDEVKESRADDDVANLPEMTTLAAETESE